MRKTKGKKEGDEKVKNEAGRRETSRLKNSKDKCERVLMRKKERGKRERMNMRKKERMKKERDRKT